MVISHNMSALNAQRQFGINLNNNTKAAEKLSSGYKINRAADDAAGLSISEKMRFQIRGLDQGARNIQEGVGYCQVADGALNEIQDMLHRITELTVKAANGTNSFSDREAIDQEIIQIKEEINRICDTTKYNEEYIFKDESNDHEEETTYNLGFSGILRDIYIYNDTYSSGTATYGGIAFEGKRYAWSSIDRSMYDANTNTFREGTYTLTATDGSYIKLICEGGSQPPQVSREFKLTADDKGIYVNKELIAWKDVKGTDGKAFDKENIKDQTYSFNYGGVEISFTPEAGETFSNVVSRIEGIRFGSTYNIPTEETAVFADFSKTYSVVQSTDDVKGYLEQGDLPQDVFTLCADDTGLSLKDSSGNVINGSEKTWAQVGISNWGDKSTYIWDTKKYTYKYVQSPSNTIEYSFTLINETSKDSVIDALDGTQLAAIGGIENKTKVSVSENANNLLSATVYRDKTNITLEEEYELGRDYSTPTDTYQTENIVYDKANQIFSVTYNGSNAVDTGDAATTVTTNKIYANDDVATGKIKDSIKNQIMSDKDAYINLIKERYVAGAQNPTDINLVSAIGTGALTGGGVDTVFVDVIELDKDSATLKCTEEDFNGVEQFAGATIDFSGLGSTYQLADLIGTGFNTNCETCSNHYSIQFATPSASNLNWQTATIDGKDYKYYVEKRSSDYTLYVDITSMEANGIKDGVSFTNTLVDLFEASAFDFHYTQYATDTTNAELYIFDNRDSYVRNGVSVATKAVFSPYSYYMNSIAEFQLDLYDSTNLNRGVSLKYQYDYTDLFKPSNLQVDYALAADGKYVLNTNTSQYELYDSTNADHQTYDRYDVTNVSLNFADLSQELDEYIVDTIFPEIAQSQLSLVGDYAKYRLDGNENENKAMVTTFTTPAQIYPPTVPTKPGDTSLKIQCSSNDIDQIIIKKHTLSSNKLGLQRINVSSDASATASIRVAEIATEKVSKIRSEYGAYQNRLEHAYAINRNVQENITASESRIRDVDMAEAMLKYSKENILVQVGQSMMAQANQSVDGVMALLQ